MKNIIFFSVLIILSICITSCGLKNKTELLTETPIVNENLFELPVLKESESVTETNVTVSLESELIIRDTCSDEMQNIIDLVPHIEL